MRGCLRYASTFRDLLLVIAFLKISANIHKKCDRDPHVSWKKSLVYIVVPTLFKALLVLDTVVALVQTIIGYGSKLTICQYQPRLANKL